MDLRSLNTFIQVAELGSFTRAGEKLGYSQPTVSFQIKQLEGELGVQLFERIGHTVSLTDGGRDALAYAQRICRLTQEMTSNRRSEASGVIRIAMADSLCIPLIERGFERFRRDYSHVFLHIIPAGTGEMFRLLDHNEVDIVCTLDNHIYSTTYIVANEERIGAHFVVSPKHPLAQAGELCVKDLLDYPFLLTEKGMSYRRIMDEILAEQSIELHPVLEIGSADMICRLVGQNMGVSFLPDYVTEVAAARGDVVRLDVWDCRVELWKQILYHRDKWLSLQMQAAIEHLSDMLMQPEPGL